MPSCWAPPPPPRPPSSPQVGLETAAAAGGRNSRLIRWQNAGFTGTHAGTRTLTTGLAWSSAKHSGSITDPYARRTLPVQFGTWTSPITSTGIAATEAIASWNAATPRGTAIRVQMRVQNQAGAWSNGPSATETAWVQPVPHTHPQVDFTARGVWDAGYQGTGNWPFNVAYAAARGMQGFVTRLRSLAEAEIFIAAGIPLVVSTSFTSPQLTGAGCGTTGHLMVIRGFDASGRFLVNDPAARYSSGVPRSYDRAQFESAWGRSGGTTYVIHPSWKALPARPSGAAW